MTDKKRLKESWVLAATSSACVWPDIKTVRFILLDLWDHATPVDEVLVPLFSRPITSDPEIGFKALLLILNILYLGPPRQAADLSQHLSTLDWVREHWEREESKELLFAFSGSHGDQAVGPQGKSSSLLLVSKLAHFLTLKLEFMAQYPQYTAHYEQLPGGQLLQPFDDKKRAEKLLHALDGLNSLAQRLPSLSRSAGGEDQGYSLSLLLPLLFESQWLLLCIADALRRLLQTNLTVSSKEKLKERFGHEYDRLKEFMRWAEQLPQLAGAPFFPPIPESYSLSITFNGLTSISEIIRKCLSEGPPTGSRAASLHLMEQQERLRERVYPALVDMSHGGGVTGQTSQAEELAGAGKGEDDISSEAMAEMWQREQVQTCEDCARSLNVQCVTLGRWRQQWLQELLLARERRKAEERTSSFSRSHLPSSDAPLSAWELLIRQKYDVEPSAGVWSTSPSSFSLNEAARPTLPVRGGSADALLEHCRGSDGFGPRRSLSTGTAGTADLLDLCWSSPCSSGFSPAQNHSLAHSDSSPSSNSLPTADLIDLQFPDVESASSSPSPGHSSFGQQGPMGEQRRKREGKRERRSSVLLIDLSGGEELPTSPLPLRPPPPPPSSALSPSNVPGSPSNKHGCSPSAPLSPAHSAISPKAEGEKRASELVSPPSPTRASQSLRQSPLPRPPELQQEPLPSPLPSPASPLPFTPPQPLSPSSSLSSPPPIPATSPLQALKMIFIQKGIAIPQRDIQLGQHIGSGAFAVVHLGMYRGRQVAVKRINVSSLTANIKALQDFHREVNIMIQMRHPNIVALVGACPDPLSILTEFCVHGNLFSLLHNKALTLDWTMKAKWALDAAKGMNYLHASTPTIIHRDLKSLNILVDSSWTCKVSDFGLSKLKSSDPNALMTGQLGTYQWMAPEVISGERYTEKADVFSYAIVLWEICTRQIPYEGLQPVQFIAQVLTKRARLPIPESCPKALSNVIRASWEHEPSRRPSFQQIVQVLERARITSG